VDDDAVRSRVLAFISDFHAAWRRSGSVPMPSIDPFADGAGSTFDPIAWAESQTLPDFAAWERELARLVADHFTPEGRTGAEGSLSGKPDHDPAGERILGVEVRRSRADVRTVLPDVNIENHFTYRLVSAAGGWRISRIVHTHAPARERVLPVGDVERLVAAIDSERVSEPVAADLAAAASALFSTPHEVTRLGTLTTSGVLVLHDLGWLAFDLVPLDRRAPAGAHVVELARDGGGTNVAVRLRFSDQEAVTRLPAARVGRDHVVGVDAGNVAVLDFHALASSEVARVEEIYQDQVLRARTSPGTVFSLTGSAPEAVVVTSGVGDGSYPAYWGVASDGSLTDLLIDFLVGGRQ
jgi:hypothetical protein